VTEFLTPDQVATELGLGKSTVYRALEAGEIPGTKVCGRWRTLRSQLEERVRDRRTPKPRHAEDPMPRPGRARRPGSSVRSKVIDLSERRAS
jgi:excisionase family DNA binding protein